MTTSNEEVVDNFARLRAISNLTRAESDEVAGRDELIQFLDRFQEGSPESAIVDSLCARFGLYPYMSGSRNLGGAESIAVEFHSPPELELAGFTFHSAQQGVYQRLMDGENVILSAPTSFGKSAIVDAIVGSQRWQTIVIIVPTDALIDETRRRLSKFRDAYSIVTHPRQPAGERTVYVFTQERFLELPDTPTVDFFMIDEFYKLGSNERDDGRRSLLNVAWRDLRGTGAQFYLTGPNVSSLNEAVGEDLRSALVVSDFATVHVELDDRSDVPDDEVLSDFIQLVNEELSGPTLVFTGTPDKANQRAIDLSRPDRADPFALEVANWIAEYFHADWDVVTALRGGVGVHSGPLMGGIQRMMIRLFDQQRIPILVCTSTIIEGVNTVAKNVVIYEKKLYRHPIDFFTFSNIRGRAGRMTRHFIGHVVSYARPPQHEDFEVDIPIESQSSSAPLSTLVQLPPGSWSADARRRMEPVLEQSELSLATIRANKGIDPMRQIAVARQFRTMTRGELADFSWTGMPSHIQERATLTMIYDQLATDRRGMNMRMMIGMLSNFRSSNGDIARVIAGQMQYRRRDQTRSDVVNQTLQFQRGWMGYTLPSGLRALQSIAREIFPELGVSVGNYEFYLSELENSFSGANLRELEEYGMPFPLARKLHAVGLLPGENPDEMLAGLAERGGRIDLSEVEEWIIADVLDGIRSA